MILSADDRKSMVTGKNVMITLGKKNVVTSMGGMNMVTPMGGKNTVVRANGKNMLNPDVREVYGDPSEREEYDCLI